MKSATITRIPQDKQTLGKWISYENGKVIFACDTIELPYLNNRPQISCIPKGVYNVVYRESAKYPRHYYIQDVPNRDLILVHQANFVGSNNPKTHKPDLLGCIGVGNGYGDINGDGIVELLRSTPTLNKLIDVMGKESFKLTIL
jgi:hypothetical protein